MGFTLAIGTAKGAWIGHSDDRRSWKLDGPYLKGWEVNTFGRGPDGSWLATTGSSWYGAAIHRSDDTRTWTQIVDGPSYEGAEDGRKLARVWTLATVGDTIFAGVADAGLFRSDDTGSHWVPVDGFNEHATRPGWQPGAGGLAAHRLLADPQNPERMWLGVSAVGVFRTVDGGAAWELVNDGVPAVVADDAHPEIGFCVHSLVADPADADTIWRQDHAGVFRTSDGGDRWERIESGLPAGFGFPITRDPSTGRLFVVPLEGSEFRSPVGGEFAVYASDDEGGSWYRAGGWSRPGYDGVLRDAMAVDGAGGVYAGSSSGRVAWSADSGETWAELIETFPRILSVHVFSA